MFKIMQDLNLTIYESGLTHSERLIAEDIESDRRERQQLVFFRLCSEFSVNARFHDKTVHILRSSEPEAEAEPPPMAARSVLDRLA